VSIDEADFIPGGSSVIPVYDRNSDGSFTQRPSDTLKHTALAAGSEYVLTIAENIVPILGPFAALATGIGMIVEAGVNASQVAGNFYPSKYSESDEFTIKDVALSSDGEMYYQVNYPDAFGTSTTGWIHTNNIYPDQSFDTGGYTGSWDSSGRIAMLHQKEIVLNAHDTENFLAAVNIVRDIASMIDLRAAAQ
jgi:hypothetical protein